MWTAAARCARRRRGRGWCWRIATTTTTCPTRSRPRPRPPTAIRRRRRSPHSPPSRPYPREYTPWLTTGWIYVLKYSFIMLRFLFVSVARRACGTTWTRRRRRARRPPRYCPHTTRTYSTCVSTDIPSLHLTAYCSILIGRLLQSRMWCDYPEQI